MTEERTIREIKINRTIDAKPEQVFKAWTEPEHFTHWFGAPLPTISMDVRPGGSWKATLDYEGTEIPFHGIYSEVEENSRLVFSLIDPNDPEFEEKQARGENEEAVTLTFTESNGKTKLGFRQTGYLPEEELPQAKEGWVSWFDALEEYLTKKS
ncbi:SRPBCC family protein [Amycolatopsis magusensis]|uniref:Uncharacterized protein YndB with AHSA1/START domain n=1 Tax=Amycolatopsis magusensis TaxID=882444 RepID=A0ABS4PQC7_9PSEU|nr:SRPBCC domain-containing protein [Amycolatopsis magusensis]MBP2181058.1 uncharacterized protein YndB with AHSA1/START domain [Amycolatopsis magusensis]MDI5980890.1 SRPBCC domain-containing protein [Amycolatopsis magusensis]UJW33013.1 SRPBCC domain-containing protein [Saccharothrix sp. AJ9571]